jgi:hypothetical protein
VCLYDTEDCVTGLALLIARLEVFMMAIMKTVLFWDVTPRRLVEVYWRFYPEDESGTSLQNVGKPLPDCTVLHPIREHFS